MDPLLMLIDELMDGPVADAVVGNVPAVEVASVRIRFGIIRTRLGD